MRTPVILTILAVLLLTGCLRTGEGTATDTIYQIQTDGLIWQTYDVWLTNDHPTANYNAIYCPEPNDKETIAAIKEAVQKKSKCTIQYHNEFIVGPWRCNSNTIIDEVSCE